MNEDFAGTNFTSPPIDWQNSVVNGLQSDVWHFNNPGNRIINPPFTPPFAIFDAEIYSLSGGVEDALLTSAPFDASVGNYCLLYLDHFFLSGAGAVGKIEAYDGTSWTEVQTISTTSATNPVHEIIDLSSICAGNPNAIIRFRWFGNGHGFWAIDNFRLYSPLNLDAGISNIDKPLVPFTTGIQSIKTTLTNFGYQTLNSATIKWSVNGVQQLPFNWTGYIQKGLQENDILIGNYNFLANLNYIVKIWSENPNGYPDPFHMNDTIVKTISAALCGDIKVGGANPDFPNITAALSYLSNSGISCPVTLKIRDGNYDEQIDLTDIKGTSAINLLTIQSESNDSSLVTITGGLFCNNVKYIRVLNIGLHGGVKFRNGSNNIKIGNSRIERAGGDNVIGILDGSHHIEINNNVIPGQSYWGISVESSSHHIIISRNVIRSCFFGGINSGNCLGIVIKNNYITNFSYQAFPGISIGGDSLTVVNNRVSRSGSAISVSGIGPALIAGNIADSLVNGGISFSSSNTTVCNNLITLRDASVYGISAGNPSYSTVAFNSINALSTSPDARAFELNAGDNLMVRNNIFANQGNGCAVLINGALSPTVSMDYNDTYSLSGKIGRYQDSTYTTFSSWKTAIGSESNGVNAKPYFVSDDNLTPNHILLDNTGLPIPGILYDSDSTLRSVTTPDIGAQEINSCIPDAGIDKITAPFAPLSTGIQNIKVVLVNQSSIPLTSATIQWAVNGSTQTPYVWNGTLATGQEVEISVGTYNFLSTITYQVSAWPSSPNGSPDCNSYNNLALTNIFYPKMCATYTIGGISPDFSSFKEVSTFLTNGGISCPVVFNVRDGNYPDWDKLELGAINGSSETNTITFQSESGDSSQVYLSAATSLTLTKSAYINIKGIHFNGSSGIGESKFINISHCMFTGSHFCLSIGSEHVSVTDCNISLFCNHQWALSVSGNHNYVANNIVDGGIMGGGNNLIVKNNSSWLISLSGDTIDILNNKVFLTELSQCGSMGFNSGITATGSYFRILNNRVTLRTRDRIMTGMSLNFNNSSVENNYITAYGEFSAIGMDVNAQNSRICFNNLKLNPVTFESKTLNISGAANLTVTNNIFSNEGGGYPVFLTGVSPSGLIMDYNDYFSLSGKIGSIDDTTYSTLALWANRINGETHGRSVNPLYTSNVLLKPNHSMLKNAGVSVPGIDYDIDSVPRNSTFPDIGAKEFTLCQVDAGINNFSSPLGLFVSGNTELKVILQNHGTDNLSSVNIFYELNGVPQPVHAWTGNLASSQSTEVSLGIHNFQEHLYRLNAWTNLPNNTTDCNTINDTCLTEKRYPYLCGTYTIGGTDPNFINFSDAAEVLNNTVISCPIVFKARSGIYPERIAFNKINGISLLNSVSFESESGNNTDVVLTYPPASGSLTSTVTINGIGFLKFKNLTIAGNYTPNYFYYNASVHMQNSRNDTIENCRLLAYNPMGSYYTPSGIEAIDCYNILIKSNYFWKGGLVYTGTHHSKISGNILVNGGSIGIPWNNMNPGGNCMEILNNECSNGIYFNGCSSDTVLVENNIVHNSSNGIYLASNGGLNATIKNNQLISITNKGICIESTSGFPNLSLRSTIINNYIQMVGSAASEGISVGSSDSTLIAFNSVNCQSANMQSKSIKITNSAVLTIKNNIFSNTGGGYSCYLDNYPVGSLFDFNNYYNTSNRLGYMGGTISPNLASWKTVVHGEANSKNYFPYFASDSSFSIYQRNLNGAAIPVPGVLTDIEGDLRNSSAPDIGADEFKVDFGIDEVIAPTLICYHVPGEHIKIHVKQFGDVPFFNIPVAYKLNNHPVVIDTIYGSVFQDTVFTFSQPIDISSQGSYTIKCWMIGNYDDNISNDSILVTRSTYPSPVPDFSYYGNCDEQATYFSGAATVAPPYTINDYHWSFGDGNTANINNPVNLYSNAGTYPVNLKVYSNMGCFGELTKPIIVYPHPVARFSVSSGNCQGMYVLFSDSSYVTSGSLQKWVWDFGDGTFQIVTAPVNQDIIHTYSNPGIYSCILNVYTSDSCMSSDTVQFTIGITPQAEFSYSSPSCLNSPLSFTDQSTAGFGGIITLWQWDFGDPASGSNNISFVQNSTHLYSGDGSYMVQLVVGNGLCSDTIQHIINVSNYPTPAISGPSSVCEESAGVTYTTEAGKLLYAWSISSTGEITAGGTTNDNFITVTWHSNQASVSQNQIHLNYTDQSGCWAPAALLNVLLKPRPVPSITGMSSVCQGSTGISYTTESGMSNYVWTVSLGGVISTGAGSNSITVTWNSAGSQYVNVNYGNADICQADSPVVFNVLVNPLPAGIGVSSGLTASSLTGLVAYYPFNGNASDESGNGNNAVVNGAILAPDRFGKVNSAYSFDGISNSVSQSVTYNLVNYNYTYSVWLKASSLPDNVNSTSISTNSFSVLSIGDAVSGDQVIALHNNYLGQPFYGFVCSGYFTPTVTISVPTNYLPAVQQWYNIIAVKDSTQLKLFIDGVLIDSISVLGQTPVYGTAQISISGRAGDHIQYFDGVIDDIQIYNRALTPEEIACLYSGTCNTLAVSLSSDSICPGSNTSLSIQNSQTGIIYQLVSSAANYGNPQTGNGTTLTFPINGLAQTASFTVLATDTATNCSITLDSTFTVYVSPAVNAVGSPGVSTCSGSSTTLFASGGTSYLWSNGMTTDTITVSPTLTTVYTVLVSNASGCSDSDSVTVSVTPLLPVSVNLTASANSVCQGDTVHFTAQTVNGGSNTTYQWFVNGIQVSSSNILNGLVAYYPFNGNALDASGNNNNAAEVTATPTTDRFGNPGSAYNFAGLSNPQIIRVPNSPSLQFTNQATFSLWVHMNSFYGMNGWGSATTEGVHMLFSKDFDQCCLYENIIGMPNGEFNTGGCTNGWYSGINFGDTVSGSTLGQWYNMTYVYTPTQGRIFSNGQLIATKSGVTTFANSNSKDLYFGRLNSFWYPLNGKLDDVRFYNRALSDAEVMQLYQGNDSTFSYVPQNGDIVTCVLTATGTCLSNNPATSNAITMTVIPHPVPTITGPVSVCNGATGNTYSTETGMTAYTWTVSPGGAITAGAGTNAITVTWNTIGAQTASVTYTNSNGCAAASATVTSVTVNPMAAPTLAGTATVCASTTGNIYTTQTGMANYVWTVSPGGTITSGGTASENTVTVTWNTPGLQTIGVNYTNPSGCTAVSSSLYNVLVNPVPVPVISGAAAVCSGSAGIVYSTQTGMSNYSWNVSSGGTIQSGSGTNTILVAWNAVGAQTVSVNYSNPSSCQAVSPTVFNVVVSLVPAPVVNGPVSVCAGTSGNTYTTDAGMNSYVWTVSPGGTITSGGTASSSSATVTWTSPGAQSVTVNYSNGSGCISVNPAYYPVTVNHLLVPVITGSGNVCLGAGSQVYSTEAGMTAYSWTVSAGGTITGGAGTNSVTVVWNIAGSQTVSVNYSNAGSCMAASPAVYNVNVYSKPVPYIAGIGYLCVNSGFNYFYSTEIGMSNYQWTVSPGGTIISGANTNLLTVTWNEPGTQWVRVNYTNNGGCEAPVPSTFHITVNPLPGDAGAISGPSSVCAGAMGVGYSIVPVPDALSYTWSLPSGASIASGAGTNSVTVDFSLNATPGEISVMGTNDCGNGFPFNYSIILNPKPAAAGAITGTATVCQGQNTAAYSVPEIADATAYAWSYSGAGAVIANATTNSITISFAANATSGNLSVMGVNSCGNGMVSALYPITIYPLPVAAGSIAGSASVCQGQNAVAYSTGEIALATGYSWSYSGTGATINNGTTNSITISFAPNATSGQLTVVGSNGCGNGSASTNFPITVNTLPVVNAGLDQSIANGTSALLSGSATGGSGSFVWHWQPADKLADPGIQNPATVNLTASTLFILTVEDSHSCSGSDAVLVTVFSPLTTAVYSSEDTVCAGDPVQLMVTTGGGSGSYTFSWSSFPLGFSSVEQNPMVYPNATSSYHVVVNDGSSVSNGYLVVTVNPLPLVPVMPIGADTVDLEITPSGVYGISGLSGAESYVWELMPASAGTILGSDTMVTINWSPDYLGEAVIRVKSANSCGQSLFSPDKRVIVVKSTGKGEYELPTLVIYPNPNDGLFLIKSSMAISKVIIRDALGKTIDVVDLPDAFHRYEYSLADGAYLVHVFINEKEYVRKIVVKATK